MVASTYTRKPGNHLALLITDPFHPVTAPTMAALRAGCSRCRVVAVHVAPASAPCPPPGVDVVAEVPAPEDDRFGGALCDIARRHKLNAVLPWTDRDACGVARHEGQLRDAGLAVVCPPHDLVTLACDKWATVQRLKQLGVPVAESRLIHAGDDLVAAARELGYPERRLILKPRSLAGGTGVWRLRADADLLAIAPSPCLPLEAMVTALNQCPPAHESDGLVVEREIGGRDTSVDVLAWEGDLLAVVTRVRQGTLGGLSVAGVVSEPSDSLRQVVEAVVAGLSWSSLANIQMVTGPTGEVTVYEINARASGSIGLARYAGVDLLSAAIHLARTGQPPAALHYARCEATAFRRH